MAREYRVLEAVHPHFPEAPRVFLLCEDPSVIGGTFFLMERRHGIRDSRFDTARAGRDSRLSAAGERSVHRLPGAVCTPIDVSDPRLSSLGKPEGFVQRQVRGWAERWTSRKNRRASGNGSHHPMAAPTHLPPSVEATLVHNDYKLDNSCCGPQGDRVEAVLDWEMTTIGDPLADLGLTMCYWTWASVAAEDDPHPATPGSDSAAGLVHARSVSRDDTRSEPGAI